MTITIDYNISKHDVELVIQSMINSLNPRTYKINNILDKIPFTREEVIHRIKGIIVTKGSVSNVTNISQCARDCAKVLFPELYQ